MKLYSSVVRNSLFVFVVMIALTGVRAAAQNTADSAQVSAVPARITQAIDETQLTRLQGNVHPLARPEFDKGTVEDWQPMNRMLLLMQRSPEQEAVLQKLMEGQLVKDSPNYHKWLTPQQFGAQFGPADADIQTVTDWLTRYGFQQIKVSAGRTAVEFSGTVGQVRNAFHTEIHRYAVNGENRQANASDPQIPAALSPVVAGIVTLHNFPRKSLRHDAGKFVRTADGVVKPLFTTTSGCGSTGTQPCYVLGPADFAKVYNIPSTLTGTGVTIALVADSNINPQDVIDFRNLFGLPANFTSSNIVLNGPDPGKNPDEGEADLDAQVSGMIAQNAIIKLVVSETTGSTQGIDLSALFIVDNNLAPVMSESFGTCELALGSTGNAFYNAIWEQAAAQGITVMVSAGDSGSAGCDNFNAVTAATVGLAVSGFASTPFNVAVGGTDFDDAGTQTSFWNPNTGNAAGTRESALGYIHEMTWNDSCAATATAATLNTVCATPNNIVAASGGPSSLYPRPSWQNGFNTAANRGLPDVSLFASDGPQSNSFYLVCQADAVPAGSPPSCASSGALSFSRVGGTSASSPAFAGIMALIVQQQGGPQGNAGPVLYKIATTASNSCNSSTQPLSPPANCVFYDVTKGNNSVPCVGKSTVTCSSQTTGTTGVLVTASGSTTPAWTAGTGYDLATGLGSVNVTNFASAWKTAVGAFQASATATKINGGTSAVTITHGTSVNLSATVTSGSGTPTGDVSFLAPTTVNGGIGSATLSGGTATLASTALPGSSYSLKAHYAGDGTFAPSDDPTGVPVTVNKENSRLQIGIVTFDPASGNITSTNATSFMYGSPYILRIDILNSTTNACQLLIAPRTSTGCAFDATGSVTITDNGSPLNGGTFVINSKGSAEDQPIQLTGGTHTLSATYSGDISYNAPSNATIDTVMVSQAATTTVLTPGATTVQANQTISLSVAISTQSNSTAGPTGNVTFKDGVTTIGTIAATPAGATATAGASATAVLNTSFTSLGTHVLTAVYAGDTNYGTSTSTAVNVMVTSQGSFTVSGTPVTVMAGGSGMSTITVTPTGGFTGMVTVSCPAAASLPPGVTCPNSPLTITVPSGGANGTGSVNLAVAAPAVMGAMASVMPVEKTLYPAGMVPTRGGGKGWWVLSGSTGLAAVLLLFLPSKKRYHAALGLGLICIVSCTLGCGGGYGGGGGGGGPVATTTKITVTSVTRAAAGATFTFMATVTGGTPTDSIQLLDNGVATGAAVAVANGTATLTTATLNVVGTHSITAHYAGDATYTQASSSGPLNVTVTGNTTVGITTSPAATPAAPALTLMIN